MTANFLLHETKLWSDVRRDWQDRIVKRITLMDLHEPRVEFDQRFPTLALVMTQEPITEKDIGYAFRNSPEELENIALHTFPGLSENTSIEKVFEAASTVFFVTAT